MQHINVPLYLLDQSCNSCCMCASITDSTFIVQICHMLYMASLHISQILCDNIYGSIKYLGYSGNKRLSCIVRDIFSIHYFLICAKGNESYPDEVIVNRSCRVSPRVSLSCWGWWKRLRIVIYGCLALLSCANCNSMILGNPAYCPIHAITPITSQNHSIQI